MKTVVITKPDFYSGEADAIVRQLDFGAERVHIRKPGAVDADMRRLLDAIPVSMRGRLALHDCHHLAVEYGIETLHLNGRNPHVPVGWKGRIGVSCHSISELSTHPEADYMFLSPVFDSISKIGYMAAFSDDELRRVDLSSVYALGGVSGRRLAELEDLGFCGAAMLGAAWSPLSLDHFRLQYITHSNERFSTVAGAEMALAGGCLWIQLRMKGASAEEVRDAARQIIPMCRRVGATFLLDDHVELVRELGADGVHVGKNDMPPSEVKRMLGPGFIVGVTANTFDDIVVAAAAGADYIGLGPFRFTTTKERLSPVIGVDGYRRIMACCRDMGIRLPVVAIGGITYSDISEVMSTGVDGIALSGAILNAEQPIKETQKICQLL